MQKEQISVFDMFKIGIGPSSSHTLGPWRAAQQFVQLLEEKQALPLVVQIKILLYGSLAKTGKGHGTDIAILLGLSGDDPVTFEVDQVGPKTEQIKTLNKLQLAGKKEVSFFANDDMLFLFNESLPYHPNAVSFQAFLSNGTAISETFYSIGGGFVVREGGQGQQKTEVDLPFPIETANNLLHWCIKTGLKISEVVMENELAWRGEQETLAGVLNIFKALNISNTETEKFTQEVSVLRNLGILDNFLTNNQAKNKAFYHKKDKKDIPRYKVKFPAGEDMSCW